MIIDWRILAGLTIILTIAFAWLLVSRADLRADLASTKAENAALHLDNAGFKSRVEVQNQAIAAWQAEADVRDKQARAAETSAKKIAASYTNAATRLSAQKSGSDGCKAANDLINLYLREAK